MEKLNFAITSITPSQDKEGMYDFMLAKDGVASPCRRKLNRQDNTLMVKGYKFFIDINTNQITHFEKCYNVTNTRERLNSNGCKKLSKVELQGIEEKIEKKISFAQIAHKAEAKKKEKKQDVGVKHDKYNQIKTCLECNIPIYLAGPAGSGKNFTVEQIADELGWNIYFSNSVQQEYKLTGFIDAGGKFHETEFYKACTDENDCIFFLDEMDASIPEVLVLLNASIANGYFEFPNGRVDLKHVHFVAAGNTVGTGADDMYTGRMILDQATLDRFAIIEFGYSKPIEMHLSNDNVELVEFIEELRESAQMNGIRATFSYRCISMVTKLEGAGMPLDEIMKIAVVKGMDKDTVNTLNPAVSISNKYYKALRKAKRSM